MTWYYMLDPSIKSYTHFLVRWCLDGINTLLKYPYGSSRAGKRYWLLLFVSSASYPAGSTCLILHGKTPFFFNTLPNRKNCKSEFLTCISSLCVGFTFRYNNDKWIVRPLFYMFWLYLLAEGTLSFPNIQFSHAYNHFNFSSRK